MYNVHIHVYKHTYGPKVVPPAQLKDGDRRQWCWGVREEVW